VWWLKSFGSSFHQYATNICTVEVIEDDGFEILLDRNEMDQWLVDQSSEEFCVDARTLVEKMGRP